MSITKRPPAGLPDGSAATVTGHRGQERVRRGRAGRLMLLALMAIGVSAGLPACGKKPGDVLAPESVQDNDPFPRRYPAS